MSSLPLATGMALGGSIIAALGAGSTMYIEEKKPSVKSISRDFIIGAAMVAMIMQLLPESTTSVIQYLLALVPLTLFSSTGQKGGSGDSVPDSLNGSEEFEVKVGVPKF